MREFILAKDELIKLVKTLPKDGVMLLSGTLASGKTTLVQEIAKFHGVKQNVTSPTFSIMQSYDGDVKIFHYDIYQNGVSGLVKNGLFENLYEDGLHLVEWGDEELENMLKIYKIPYTIINIKTKENLRIYEVKSA
ncbi:tRNA (adenosine(37)-N6)-threonylcarbamoyltransferase complex ATPase subunit type 1 TsaE [Campylobacter sp. RM13119]|uniref:tRNA (adenosine(37)-N6)-threonylcarbamoyltransferase complex ATPase subunit type 1 TsaE n=1 Tax=Campylobacter TaxID=194 RepID=UPI0014750D69|nr:MULTISPECIES: tRNA (adenosine(37)-N6)-threonylcarbamoyltransferase complex ATPase subunit type 1 TsaE [unclassified Campylobacter]MBE3605529.1 tRNA (adenosine(37)-N6)-threonylcarbamoyltransferase complex ATPase subunit type 1 TsaE [Campylobacter sp. RM13119]